jgi:hypothetical protein
MRACAVVVGLSNHGRQFQARVGGDVDNLVNPGTHRWRLPETVLHASAPFIRLRPVAGALAHNSCSPDMEGFAKSVSVSFLEDAEECVL